jgi:hypothetical protein
MPDEHRLPIMAILFQLVDDELRHFRARDPAQRDVSEQGGMPDIAGAENVGKKRAKRRCSRAGRAAASVPSVLMRLFAE